MQRLVAVVIVLSLGVLACNTVLGGAATAVPDGPPTQAAVTPTGQPQESTLTPAPATPTVEAATLAPTLVPVTATPAPFACAVAYADQGNLFCLNADGAPQVLASAAGGGRPWLPRISQDGQLVAYQLLFDNETAELWVVGADPAAVPPRRLVAAEQIPHSETGLVNSPADPVEWLGGSHILAFETRWVSLDQEVGPGERTNADLWVVDADSGALRNLLPAGSAGRFAASPDGNLIAVSRPDGLDLVNADGANYRQGLITFPPIITYSEYAYRPEAVWSPDSTFFSVAVPSADPLAPDPSASFYRIGADGVVTPLASVPGNFVFGGAVRPFFAPDGQHLVYSQNVPEAQQDALHLVALAGASNQVVDQQPAPSGWAWSPDAQRFAYTVTPGGAPGSAYVLGVDGAVQPAAAGLSAIRALQWLDSTTFLFLGQLNGGEWALYRQALGQEPALVASGLSDTATLDVR